MASLIDELVEVLEKENSEYEALIALSKEKTSTIVKNDIDGLQKIMDQEQRGVDRVNALEKHRENTVKDICKVLRVQPQELTVKVLIDLLKKQPVEQKKLMDIYTKIRKTLDEMVRLNESNQALIKESMEILDFEMNLIKGMRMAPETNNYNKGAYSAGGTDYGAGAFDAKQ
ncbi:MAG: flagellar protein FlgN [Lachnospiraceae bacterium]